MTATEPGVKKDFAKLKGVLLRQWPEAQMEFLSTSLRVELARRRGVERENRALRRQIDGLKSSLRKTQEERDLLYETLEANIGREAPRQPDGVCPITQPRAVVSQQGSAVGSTLPDSGERAPLEEFACVEVGRVFLEREQVLAFLVHLLHVASDDAGLVFIDAVERLRRDALAALPTLMGSISAGKAALRAWFSDASIHPAVGRR